MVLACDSCGEISGAKLHKITFEDDQGQATVKQALCVECKRGLNGGPGTLILEVVEVD